MKKKVFLLALILICTATVSAEEYSGYDLGEINPIRDVRDIIGEPEIVISDGAVNAVIDEVSPSFVAYASVHNRTAIYFYDVVFSKKIFVNDVMVAPGYVIDGKCDIRALIKVRYKTSDLNINKGWPKYYYLSTENTLSVGETSPGIEYNVKGFIYHTEEWNKKRRAYNEYLGYGECDGKFITYDDYLNSSGGRYKNVFWPGEKVILKCEAVGSEYVTVSYGSYSKRLKNTGNGVFTGEIVLDFLSSLYPLKLTFKSDKGTDIVIAIVDGREEYWGFHRRK